MWEAVEIVQTQKFKVIGDGGITVRPVGLVLSAWNDSRAEEGEVIVEGYNLERLEESSCCHKAL